MFSTSNDNALAAEWARSLQNGSNADEDINDERKMTMVGPGGFTAVWYKEWFRKWYYNQCKFTFFYLCGHNLFLGTNYLFSFLIVFIYSWVSSFVIPLASFVVISLFSVSSSSVPSSLSSLFFIFFFIYSLIIFGYLVLVFSNQYEDSLGEGTEPKGYKYSQNPSREWVGRGREYRNKYWKNGVSLSRQKTRKEKKSNKTRKKKKK